MDACRCLCSRGGQDYGSQGRGRVGVMVLENAIRSVLGSDGDFYRLLERQARAVEAGVRALHDYSASTIGPEQALRALREVERTADEAAHEMEVALSRTVLTPIHREDLHRLSTELTVLVRRIRESFSGVAVGLEE